MAVCRQRIEKSDFDLIRNDFKSSRKRTGQLLLFFFENVFSILQNNVNSLIFLCQSKAKLENDFFFSKKRLPLFVSAFFLRFNIISHEQYKFDCDYNFLFLIFFTRFLYVLTVNKWSVIGAIVFKKEQVTGLMRKKLANVSHV